jgi:hypothetical protein
MRMPSQVSASVIEFRYAEVLLETPVRHLQIRTMVTCILYTVCAMEILALPKRIPSVDVRVVVFDAGTFSECSRSQYGDISLIRLNVEIGESRIWDVLDAVQCAKFPRVLVLNRCWYGGFL